MVPMNVDSSTVAATSIITAVITFFFATTVGQIKPAAALALAVIAGLILYLIGVIPIGLLFVVGVSMIVAIFKTIASAKTSNEPNSENTRRLALGYVDNQYQPNTKQQSKMPAVSRTIACPNCKVNLLFRVAGDLQCSCPQCKTIFSLDSGDRIYDMNKPDQFAESGDAQVMPSETYYEDTETQKDYQKARLFFKAAHLGRASAQHHLGTLYTNGKGVPQDYAQAAAWFLKAAIQGHADAQLKLGLFYMQGHGVPQDRVQATEWLRKAAVQGNASAQFNLGASYNNGQGAPQDYAQAVQWFRKAADQGSGDAQFSLGLLSMHGHGVPLDYILAMSWFHIALAHGFFNHVIAQKMPELNALFTPAQIAQAEKLASEWLAAHH